MHIYECNDGTKVPSVTTVLQILGNKELLKWANYLGFKHIDYDAEMNRTANIGNKIHTCLQHIVDPSLWDHPITYRDKLEEDYYQRIADRFTREISKYTYETHFTEKSFSSSKLGYGGTIDWYATMAGFNMINDFKSSKQVRLKHLLQLGGYYNLMTEDGYDIHGGSIIIANEKTCSLYPVNQNDMKTLGEIFNRIHFVYMNTVNMIPADKDFLEKLRDKR